MDRRDVLKFLGGIIPGGAATVIAAPDPEGMGDMLKTLRTNDAGRIFVTAPGTKIHEMPQQPPLFVLTLPETHALLSAEDHDHIKRTWAEQFKGSPPPLVVLQHGATLSVAARGLGPYSFRERYEEREVEITFGTYDEMLHYWKHTGWWDRIKA